MTAPTVLSASNKRERVRRIAQFPLVRLVAALTVFIVAMALANLLASATGASGGWARTLITIVLLHAAYVLYVRRYEQRAATEFDRWSAGRELILSALAGVLLFSMCVAIVAVAGGMKLEAWMGWGGLRNALALAVGAAYVEELLFRGIIYRMVEELTGTWIALFFSAALFGAMHAANPSATLWASVAVALEAGVLLAVLFIWTRRLWVPIGLHLGWNLAQGGVFGLNVSGQGRQGMLQATLEGPAWLTGGAFGLEASVVAVAICTGVAAFLLHRAYRQRRTMAPMWSPRRKDARAR